MGRLAALPVAQALGSLSREDRALAFVATTLAGRAAPGLTLYLDQGRAPLVDGAIAALLALPVAERSATLAGEARRLAASAPGDPRGLHPERRRRLLAAEPGGAGALLAALAGEPAPASLGRAHRAALDVVVAWLEEAVAPAPGPEEVAAAPPPVRALLRASAARLEAVAGALGPVGMRAILGASPPVVAAWLRQRLPPALEAEIGAAAAADPAAALTALTALTRMEEAP
jgi:hypothetical protein